jgi:hypothetical protein
VARRPAGPDVSETVRIAMTGAYLTGFALEVDPLPESAVRKGQAAFARALNELSNADHWAVPRYGTEAPSLRYSGAAYEGLLPSGFVQTSTPYSMVEAFESHLALYEGTQAGQDLDLILLGTEWAVNKVHATVYPFGVGTIAVTYVVTIPKSVSGEMMRDLVAEVKRALVPLYDEYLRQLSTQLRAAVEGAVADIAALPWIHGHVDPLEPLEKRVRRLRSRRRIEPDRSLDWLVKAPPSTLLWLHSVYLLEREDATPSQEIEVLPFLHEEHNFAGLTYYPGTESTVAVWPPPRRGDGSSHEEGIVNLILLQWAYFAAGSEIDRALWARLNRLGDRSLRTRDLEDDLHKILIFYERTRVLRGRLNTLLAEYGGGFLALWEAGAGVQGLSQLFASVDDKLDAVQKICRNKLDEIAAARERRLDRAVALFTIFTVVSSIAVVIAFFTPQPTQVDLLRALLVFVAASSTVGVMILSRREGHGR